MAIIRDHNRKYFCAVDSRIIRNRMLTIPALGFLTALLDRSDGWQFRSVEVSRTLNLTPEETSRLFSELIKGGFAVERRDRYGLYYNLYSFPANPPQQTAAVSSPPTANAVPDLPDAVPTTANAAPGAVPMPPTANATPDLPDAVPTTANAAPGAVPMPEVRREPGPMTDEEREAWFNYIKANFKPSRNYRSPYRD